jgi:urease accessory protein
MTSFAGHLSLRAAARPGGRTVLAEQSFRAPYHLSKPYWDSAANALLVQVVNPTAGILEGDALEMSVAVDEGAALLLTTPSANRVFQMKAGSATCRQTFSVAGGGWLEVWPEPLVPHLGSRYRQTTELTVDGGGELMFADVLLPGRVARGEKWAWESLQLETTLRIAGALVLRERFSLSGEEFRVLAELAGRAESACFANVVVVSTRLAESSEWKGEIASLHSPKCWVGLSALHGNVGAWSIKLVAEDGIGLRETFRSLRTILSKHLPRMTCDPRKL